MISSCCSLELLLLTRLLPVLGRAVGIVVADVLGQVVGVVVKLGDSRRRPIQEVPVVGHGHQAAAVAAQERLQPGRAGEVEVVGRLVQEQQVRRPQQQRRQHHPRPLPARERPDAPVARQVCQPQAGQHGVDPVIQVVAATALEPLGDVAILGQGSVERGALDLGQPRFEQAQSVLQAPQPANGIADQILDGQPGHVRLLLGQVADLDAARYGHSAGVGVKLAGDDPEQRRLAGAVRADEPDALAGPDLERDGVEHDHRPVRLGDLVDG